jgi:GR25 family glycosyltransferase involved in LPS biosynthesis
MKGIYINLEKRVDRREHFETNVKRHPFFSGIERMTAVEIDDGAIGCGLSHIKALLQYRGGEEPYVAIIEDDFMVFDETALSTFAVDFEKIKDSDSWKIIVLTPRGITVQESNDMTAANFLRIKENQTTTGYIVKREMIPVLCQNINEAIDLQSQGVNKNISSIDQYWKRLQLTYPFYYYSTVFAGQLPGWSDIEQRQVDYNDRFRNQRLY